MRINLTVIKGPHRGREFSFAGHDNFIVGRAEFAHFRLPIEDKFFSRIHFMVEVNPPLCRLFDMKSTNGTLVNGRKIQIADLHDGDLITAGKTVIRLTLHETEGKPGGEILPSHLGSFAVGFGHGRCRSSVHAPKLKPIRRLLLSAGRVGSRRSCPQRSRPRPTARAAASARAPRAGTRALDTAWIDPACRSARTVGRRLARKPSPSRATRSSANWVMGPWGWCFWRSATLMEH